MLVPEQFTQRDQKTHNSLRLSHFRLHKTSVERICERAHDSRAFDHEEENVVSSNSTLTRRGLVSAELDPIFAVIEAHKLAYKEFGGR